LRRPPLAPVPDPPQEPGAGALLDDLRWTWRTSPGLAISEAMRWSEDELAELAVQAGADPSANELLLLLDDLRRRPEPTAERLRRIIVQSYESSAGLVPDPRVADEERALAPRWSAGNQSVQQALGGFQGLTVLAGATGLGKSSWALSSALSAALDGQGRIAVVYLNAELDRPTVSHYVRRWLRSHGLLDAPDELALLGRTFHHFEVTPAVTLQRMAEAVQSGITGATERVLVVIDTVNTLAEKLVTEAGTSAEFQALRSIGLWAMEARRLSNGDIGCLLVSETNKEGGIYGAKLHKWADLALLMTDSDVPTLIDVRVVKGRYVGSPTLGAFRFDPDTGLHQKVDPSLPNSGQGLAAGVAGWWHEGESVDE